MITISKFKEYIYERWEIALAELDKEEADND